MKRIISVTLLSCLLMGALIAGMKIFSDRIDAKRNAMDGIEKEIYALEQKKKNVKSLEAILADAKDERTIIEHVFVNERSIVRVIEALEDTASLSRVTLTVQSAALPTSSALRGPEFQLRAEGEFGNVYRFLQLLETIPFQITFNVISMSKNETGVAAGGWSSTIRFTLISFVPR